MHRFTQLHLLFKSQHGNTKTIYEIFSKLTVKARTTYCFGDSDRIWTHNHLVRKRTLNHLAKLAFLNDWGVLWVLICTVHLTLCYCRLTLKLHVIVDSIWTCTWYDKNMQLLLWCFYFWLWTSKWRLGNWKYYKKGSVNILCRVFVTWCIFLEHRSYPANIYLLKVNRRNTRKRCEICSKLAIKTPKRCQWRRSSVFIVNFEHISHLFLVFLL